ncbi:MAG: nucleotidyltransferase domain-containing protein [Candidatus Schekmanbacteria bacterium]|nr:nucleotidyltransferase domain-containing protein [Candidatus Schekmanbacteria bacterium]
MKTLSFLTLQEKQALQELSLILHEIFPVAEIILFGSKARGDFDVESDIDLLILTGHKIDRKKRHEITHYVFEVNLKYDVNISTLVIPKKEWEEGLYPVLPIYWEISEQGILI